MAFNAVNYATKFERQLKQKYTAELRTAALTSPEGGQGIRFVDAKTIKIPYVKMKGYKDHSRDGGFNRQPVENKWLTKELDFDRDVEFFVDVMDVDESNQVLAAANTTNVFLEEQAIPETDCYRISKMHSEFVTLGGTVDNGTIDFDTALEMFDTYMREMDEAEVPQEGRLLYVTPTVEEMFKRAKEISRSVNVTNNNGKVDRVVKSLDNVQIKQIPSSRMKTQYDFSDGTVPALTAKQINMIMAHPKSIIAVDKHAYIRFWPPGTHTLGDGYLYQNRKYGDLFLIDTRLAGVRMNVEA